MEIIEVETGRRVGSVEQTDARPIAITFANNDQTLLVCGDAYWWRAERSNGWKAPVKSETSITKDDYPVAVFNSSAGYLAVGVNGEARARPHELRLWDMATDQKQPPIPVSDAIACVAVSADGRRLALGSATGVARVWEIEGDDRRLVAEVAHQDGIRTIALDATGDRLVTCGKSWQLWDVDSARPLSASLNYHWKANTVTFRPKKPGILFQGSDSVIRLWSLPSDLPYEPRRLAQWVEIKTALRRDERGNLVRLSAKEWWSRRTELDSPESE